MKFKLICVAVLAAFTFTACVTDSGVKNPNNGNPSDAAYISLTVETPNVPGSRASAEEPATATENAIKTLRAIVFDSNLQVMKHDKATSVAQELTGFNNTGSATEEKTNAFVVPGSSKYLLIVANPGPELKARLDALTVGTAFSAVNAVVKHTTPLNVSEINGTNGFTMINSGKGAASDTDPSSPAVLALIDLTGKIQVVSGNVTDDDAKVEAEKDANRVQVQIERLSSKIEVAEVSGGAVTVAYEDKTVEPAVTATPEFTFTSWVLDVVNTQFFPWAKKVTLASTPGNASFYAKNFYVIDPNYETNEGIAYNAVDIAFPTGAGITTPVYVMENTMKANEQDNDKATRAVIKAKYYPNPAWKSGSADWFSYGGIDYKSLEMMVEAYKAEAAPQNLKDACDRFFLVVKGISDGGTGSVTATKFEDLTQAMLTGLGITDGGQKVREGDPDCIWWYQGGLCYYYFPIKHDDSVTGSNEFAKYGVVRNNWYDCTITKVNQAGTPWYPEIDENPIDETEGYISATINIGPWVKWSTNYEI